MRASALATPNSPRSKRSAAPISPTAELIRCWAPPNDTASTPGPDRHRLVGQRVKLRIALVEREDGGPGPPCVVDALEQRDRRGRRRHDEERLAPLGGFQPLQTDPQVRRRALGDPPADERGHQLGNPGQPAFLVQVSGEMPGLLVGGADQQEAALRAGGLAQPLRERSSPLEPSGRGKERTERGHLVRVHVSMVPLNVRPRSQIRTESCNPRQRAGAARRGPAAQRQHLVGCSS